MKRTKEPKKADAILTADLHLTEKTPVSRTDDYLAAQRKKLRFLQDLSERNGGCPILCAGDIFDSWKASPWLCSIAFSLLPLPFICIPGQHDLPAHSLKRYDRSALCLLDAVSGNGFRVLNKGSTSYHRLCVVGAPFGTLDEFDPGSVEPQWWDSRKILMLHELVWLQRDSLQAKIGGSTGDELVREFGQHFDLILTGDNHESFTVRVGDTLLVNPGSMMRMTADQDDYEPKCYLYYARDNSVTPVKYPIQSDVHNREHIDKAKERDERIAAYIERMSEDWDLSLSFEQNLRAYFDENRTSRKVREIVWTHLEKA